MVKLLPTAQKLRLILRTARWRRSVVHLLVTLRLTGLKGNGCHQAVAGIAQKLARMLGLAVQNSVKKSYLRQVDLW